MKAEIAILAGDGIGPEVSAAAAAVIDAVAEKYSHELHCHQGLIGGAAIEVTGKALPEETSALCARVAAVFLGAVGGPQWSDPEAAVRPEQGLLALRRQMGLYANLRPVTPHPALSGASPLRPERLRDVDIMVVRELTGGIYFGDKYRDADRASDLCSYTRKEIERIARIAARLASERRGTLVSIDKANVLETSRLWRQTVTRIVADEFPKLRLEHLLVDAAAMHLLDRAATFDVLVTENMFGDILTDEASMLAGSLGMLPSASLGAGKTGLYEPIHGSAPDIAGQNKANPCAAIASVAMMFRHSFDLDAEANAIDAAIQRAIDKGGRTADIATEGEAVLSTRDMTGLILQELG